MKIKGITLRDLAIYISDYLRKNGINTVLSGGACVAIYTKNKYTSYDLDFVMESFSIRKSINSILEKIGFIEHGRYFVHKETPFFLDFLVPPLSVGEEPVKKIVSIKKKNMILKLLSPTDCIKDRLAAFYHWNDIQSMDQAILVAKGNKIDLKEIERWSINEGMIDKFKIFKRKSP